MSYFFFLLSFVVLICCKNIFIESFLMSSLCDWALYDFVFGKFICGIGFDLTLEVVFKNLKCIFIYYGGAIK